MLKWQKTMKSVNNLSKRMSDEIFLTSKGSTKKITFARGRVPSAQKKVWKHWVRLIPRAVTHYAFFWTGFWVIAFPHHFSLLTLGCKKINFQQGMKFPAKVSTVKNTKTRKPENTFGKNTWCVLGLTPVQKPMKNITSYWIFKIVLSASFSINIFIFASQTFF